MFPVMLNTGEIERMKLREIFSTDAVISFAYPLPQLNNTAVMMLCGLISSQLKKQEQQLVEDHWLELLTGEEDFSELPVDLKAIEASILSEGFMTVPKTEKHLKAPLRDLLVPHVLGGETTKAHCANIRKVEALCSSCASVLSHSYQSMTSPMAKYWSTLQMHSRLFCVLTLKSLRQTIIANLDINDTSAWQPFPWENKIETPHYCELIGSKKLSGSDHAQLPMTRALYVEYANSKDHSCWMCGAADSRMAKAIYLCAEDSLASAYPQFEKIKKVDFGSMYAATLHHPQLTYIVKEKEMAAILSPVAAGKYRLPIWHQLSLPAKAKNGASVSKAKTLAQWSYIEEEALYDSSPALTALTAHAYVSVFGFCYNKGRDIKYITDVAHAPSFFRFDGNAKTFIESATAFIKSTVDNIESLKSKNVTTSGSGNDQKLRIAKEGRSADISEIAHEIDALWRDIGQALQQAACLPYEQKAAYFDNKRSSLRKQCFGLWNKCANVAFTELDSPFYALFLISTYEKRLVKGLKL